MSDPASSEDDLTVMRCRRCGDVFPAHESEPAACPSCGGGELEPAREPAL